MSALNHSPKLRMEQVSAFKAMYVDKQIHSKYHKTYSQAIEMVQQVKAPVAKLYDLSFISRTHVIGKTSSCKLFSNLHVCTVTPTHP